MNGSDGRLINSESMISETNFLVDPVFSSRHYADTSSNILTPSHSHHMNRVTLNHQVADLGRTKNEEKVNYAAKVMTGMNCTILSNDAGLGSSGGLVLDTSGKVVGLIQGSLNLGSSEHTLAMSPKEAMSIVNNLIDNKLNVPYIGVQLKQDKFMFEGYLINKVNPKSIIVEQATVATNDVISKVTLEEGESIICELVSVNTLKVGPKKSQLNISALQTAFKPGDSVDL